MRIIRAAALTPAPWKNGGGITREIARLFDDRGLLWRLSLAEIERDGPFSDFAGLERILTVIAGSGLVLEMPNRSPRLDRMDSYRFAGTTPVTARLSAGPVSDLNLMFRSDTFAGSVQPMRGEARQGIGPGPGETLVVHVVAVGATLNGADLGPGDTVLDAAGDLVLPARGEAIRISIVQRPAAPIAK